MANGVGPPFPSREPHTDPTTGLFVPAILKWFRGIRDEVDATPQQVAVPLEVSAQNAAIGTTPIPTDPLAPGLYRVTGYVRVTTAALTSSSVAVSIAWVDGGVSCTETLIAAVTGNATDSTGSDTMLVRIDQATPISYATTYASNGVGEMHYDLVLVLEQVDS